MSVRFPAWPVLIGILSLCAGSLIVANWWRSQREAGLAELIRYLPSGSPSVLYLDLTALDRAGLLNKFAGSRATQDAEYRRFIEESGFDYQRDLKSALVAFQDDGAYFLLAGTFDWEALRNYAQTHGGSCRFSVCRMPGSRPDRAIGWYPVRPNVMALATASDPGAIWNIMGKKENGLRPFSDSPVWLSTTGRALGRSTLIPDGGNAFARYLSNADRVTFSVDATSAAGWTIAFRAACSNEDIAGELARQLAVLTGTLNQMLAREKRQANPADLSGVLTGGNFQARGNHVDGRWPLPKPFVESLLD
jgi:hypothetical protein